MKVARDGYLATNLRQIIVVRVDVLHGGHRDRGVEDDHAGASVDSLQQRCRYQR